jgi:DNA-binding LacI/PurR family transcriptional regulator
MSQDELAVKNGIPGPTGSEKFDKVPKFKRLINLLRQEIVNSKLTPGDKFLTELEIAEKYNVSRGIVREAIQSLVHEGLVTRTAGKGTFITAPEQRANKQIKSINILLPYMNASDFISKINRAIEDTAFNRDYQVTVSNTSNNFEKLDKYFDQIINNQSSAGIIFIPLHTKLVNDGNLSFIKKVQEHNLPLVIVDRLPLTENQPLDFDYVLTDNFHGGYIGTKHLIELGHERIGYIGDFVLSSAQDRFNGYKKALEENNIPFDVNLTNRTEQLCEWDKQGKITGQLMSLTNPPTAIFAEHDGLAQNVLDNLYRMGMKVPDDISLIGYDDLDFSEGLFVPLTTVRQPINQEGTLATEILLDKIEGKTKELKQVVLPVELIVRKSTAKPNKGAK